MQKKYYFLIEDLNEKRTGIETSSLNRSRLFVKSLGIVPTIVTVKYNPKLNIQRRDLLKSGMLLPGIEILNMYEYFQETQTVLNPLSEKKLNRVEGFEYKNVEGTHDYRISNNDGLITYWKCDEEGRLLFTNLFMNRKKVRRDWYDLNGFLSKTQHLDTDTGRTISETYYRTDGSACFHKHFTFKDNKNILMGIHLLNREGIIINVFNTEADLIEYWFSLILEQDYENNLLIDKERVFYPILSKMKSENMKLLCAIHSSHLATGQDIMSGRINSNYKEIFQNLSIPDAVIVLTEKQRSHIEQRFGKKDNLYVIPHTLEEIPEKVLPSNRTHKKIAYLGRFAEEKQLDHLITAFKKVVQVHPDAKLDLYGYGSLEATYRDMINNNDLNTNITIHGFTSNIDAVYNSAGLIVLPSKVEGFSLFLLEAIAHGCPMICYDINYSPSDMIDHGINGYLVEPNNIEDLAEQIIHYFNNPELLEKMSEASYRKFSEFSPEKVSSKWRQL